MSTAMTLTLVALAAEVAIFVLCLVRVRQPVDPLRPRLLPYNLIMILMVVAIFATVAHIISLMTGQQLMPRRGKGMR
jgi:hypothetical protein